MKKYGKAFLCGALELCMATELEHIFLLNSVNYVTWIVIVAAAPPVTFFHINLIWLRARYSHKSNEHISGHFASENESISFWAQSADRETQQEKATTDIVIETQTSQKLRSSIFRQVSVVDWLRGTTKWKIFDFFQQYTHIAYEYKVDVVLLSPITFRMSPPVSLCYLGYGKIRKYLHRKFA